MTADPMWDPCPNCLKLTCDCPSLEKAPFGTYPNEQAEIEQARHTTALATEVNLQRIRRQARRLLDAEDRPPIRAPEVLTLAERLARPREPVTYRIDGWQPTGTRVLLAAQFKAGKTTLVGNVARCLLDGHRWLGQYAVAPVAGTLVDLDFEMSPNQLDDWMADQHITNDDRMVPIPLRGNAGAFDILDDKRRAEWAGKLTQLGCQYLILDCLRPVLDSLGLDEHRDAGRFLVAFDALLAEAGVGDALVVHHMGHVAERSRGDSRIRDWPDVEWRLVRQDDDPSSPRFVAAYGRDVDQSESQLHFDPATRHLTMVGGSRKDAAARAALVAVLDVLDDDPGMTGRAIEARLAESEHSQKAVRDAVRLGKKDGQIRVEPGPRNALRHFSASVRQSASQRTDALVSECVSASIERRTHAAAAEPEPERVADALTEPIRCECGNPLLHPRSKRDGVCEKCRLIRVEQEINA